jgi:hypothetical protein
VYGFIEEIERKLPGMVIVTNLKLTRNGDPSPALIVDLGQHKLTPIVTGEMTFLWIGMRPNASTSGGTP